MRIFKAHDERRLNEDYAHYSDMEKMQAKARSDASTLERLFEEDVAEVAKAGAAGTDGGGARAGRRGGAAPLNVRL